MFSALGIILIKPQFVPQNATMKLVSGFCTAGERQSALFVRQSGEELIFVQG